MNRPRMSDAFSASDQSGRMGMVFSGTTFARIVFLLHVAVTGMVGYSLHRSYWLVGVVAGVCWLAALFWLGSAIAARNGRSAMGLFVIALILGVCGFVAGFTTY